MSIKFHCKYCDTEIKAADNAGGKWGKCPRCHNKVYVPDLSDDEQLKLAPVDEQDEREKQKLMEETYQLSRHILEERETDNGGKNDRQKNNPSPKVQLDDRQLKKFITSYLQNISNGDLESADTKLNSISACGDRALKVLDSIALSEMPEPELINIPPHVLSGLIKDLRSKIS